MCFQRATRIFRHGRAPDVPRHSPENSRDGDCNGNRRRFGRGVHRHCRRRGHRLDGSSVRSSGRLGERAAGCRLDKGYHGRQSTGRHCRTDSAAARMPHKAAPAVTRHGRRACLRARKIRLQAKVMQPPQLRFRTSRVRSARLQTRPNPAQADRLHRIQRPRHPLPPPSKPPHQIRIKSWSETSGGGDVAPVIHEQIREVPPMPPAASDLEISTSRARPATRRAISADALSGTSIDTPAVRNRRATAPQTAAPQTAQPQPAENSSAVETSADPAATEQRAADNADRVTSSQRHKRKARSRVQQPEQCRLMPCRRIRPASPTMPSVEITDSASSSVADPMAARQCAFCMSHDEIANASASRSK